MSGRGRDESGTDTDEVYIGAESERRAPVQKRRRRRAAPTDLTEAQVTAQSDVYSGTDSSDDDDNPSSNSFGADTAESNSGATATISGSGPNSSLTNAVTISGTGPNLGNRVIIRGAGPNLGNRATVRGGGPNPGARATVRGAQTSRLLNQFYLEKLGADAIETQLNSLTRQLRQAQGEKQAARGSTPVNQAASTKAEEKVETLEKQIEQVKKETVQFEAQLKAVLPNGFTLVNNPNSTPGSSPQNCNQQNLVGDPQITEHIEAMWGASLKATNDVAGTTAVADVKETRQARHFMHRYLFDPTFKMTKQTLKMSLDNDPSIPGQYYNQADKEQAAEQLAGLDLNAREYMQLVKEGKTYDLCETAALMKNLDLQMSDVQVTKNGSKSYLGLGSLVKKSNANNQNFDMSELDRELQQEITTRTAAGVPQDPREITTLRQMQQSLRKLGNTSNVSKADAKKYIQDNKAGLDKYLMARHGMMVEDAYYAKMRKDYGDQCRKDAGQTDKDLNEIKKTATNTPPPREPHIKNIPIDDLKQLFEGLLDLFMQLATMMKCTVLYNRVQDNTNDFKKVAQLRKDVSQGKVVLSKVENAHLNALYKYKHAQTKFASSTYAKASQDAQSRHQGSLETLRDDAQALEKAREEYTNFCNVHGVTPGKVEDIHGKTQLKVSVKEGKMEQSLALANAEILAMELEVAKSKKINKQNNTKDRKHHWKNTRAPLHMIRDLIFGTRRLASYIGGNVEKAVKSLNLDKHLSPRHPASSRPRGASNGANSRSSSRQRTGSGGSNSSSSSSSSGSSGYNSSSSGSSGYNSSSSGSTGSASSGTDTDTDMDMDTDNSSRSRSLSSR